MNGYCIFWKGMEVSLVSEGLGSIVCSPHCLAVLSVLYPIIAAIKIGIIQTDVHFLYPSQVARMQMSLSFHFQTANVNSTMLVSCSVSFWEPRHCVLLTKFSHI